MDIKTIRRTALQKLIDDRTAGNKAEFARRYDLDATFISQIINGHRGMGEKAARKMEGKIGLDDGYLDNAMNAGVPLEEAIKLVGSPVKGYGDPEELDADTYDSLLVVGIRPRRLPG